MERLKMPEGEAIEAGIVTRSIESAQRKVEGRNFDMRKQLLEYDDVANDQRKVIYQQRNAILDAPDLLAQITALREGCFTDLVRQYVPVESVEEQWDIAGLEQVLREEWQIELPLRRDIEAASSISDEDVLEKVGIHLRGYAQKQPKQEYKREAFELFGQLLDSVKNEVTKVLMTVRVQSSEQIEQAAEALESKAEHIANVTYTAPTETGEVETTVDEATQVAAMPRVGRNDPCPCGSGKKFKHCHGKSVASIWLRAKASAPSWSTPAMPMLAPARKACSGPAAPPEQILPFSTGVIMEQLPSERIVAGLPAALADAREDHWARAAEAIMTTDTVPKAYSTRQGRRHDPTEHGDHAWLSGHRWAHSAEGRALKTAMLDVARQLAQAIVRDGEGATKFITVRVQGGKTAEECRLVAYAIAHSPLVKTAFYASDPNLGRILAAVGYAGITDLDQSKIDLHLDDVHVAVQGGRNPSYREEDGQRVMKQSEITVRVVLGRGQAEDTVWTCDFSHDYVSINADYRS
ncbi:unnamed protein product [Victoria cruziana]